MSFVGVEIVNSVINRKEFSTEQIFFYILKCYLEISLKLDLWGKRYGILFYKEGVKYIMLQISRTESKCQKESNR